MQRHPSLVPLSHDHHHALVQARRLRSATEGDPRARKAASADFLRFFSGETLRHFREEEERLFPSLVGVSDAAEALLAEAVLDHQRIHATVARLDRSPDDAATMAELAELLERHVRLEERQLFPLIEETLPDALDGLGLAAGRGSAVVELLAPRGRGPLWGTATDDLNATLLAWGPGEGVGEHVNAGLDVMLLVLEGSATVTVDGHANVVHAGDALVLEKGRSRTIEAGPEGVRYVTVHRRRPPLATIRPAPPRSNPAT